MDLIELSSISKSYDGMNKVINNINLSIKEKEFLILVGPSGCGKSTLLRMIAGLESITDGTLRINGSIANHMRPKDRNISMVFQNYALYPHMSVRENILFGLDIKKVPKEEQERRLHETAEMIGLAAFLKRKPGELSGGQRQRVALARSICSHAKICLMDEPLSNLDAKLRGQMRSEIRRLQKQLGLTIIYVTHDQVEAMTMGDRIAVLNEGIIQQLGTPLDLYNCPANQFVAGFIGSPQINMFNVIKQDNKLIFNNELSMNINESLLSRLPDCDRYNVGVRAEHIASGQRTGSLSFKAKVVSTELMGNETLVYFKIGKNTYTARWHGQWLINDNAPIDFAIAPESFHFFSEGAGERLSPMPASVSDKILAEIV